MFVSTHTFLLKNDEGSLMSHVLFQIYIWSLENAKFIYLDVLTRNEKLNKQQTFI